MKNSETKPNYKRFFTITAIGIFIIYVIIIIVLWYKSIRTCESIAQQRWATRKEVATEALDDCNGPNDPECKKAEKIIQENDKLLITDRQKCAQ